jgi:hypothetical protein
MTEMQRGRWIARKAKVPTGGRICDAKFGTLYLCYGDKLRLVSAHKVPAAFADRPTGLQSCVRRYPRPGDEDRGDGSLAGPLSRTVLCRRSSANSRSRGPWRCTQRDWVPMRKDDALVGIEFARSNKWSSFEARTMAPSAHMRGRG